MTKPEIPVGITTAALLKSQLDQGKDYFDLLIPFVKRAIAGLAADLVRPNDVRDGIAAVSSLQVPLRTVVVLLDRLCRAKTLRKESGAYFVTDSGRSSLAEWQDHSSLTPQFEQLGVAYFESARELHLDLNSPSEALEDLAGFLEAHGASLLLEDRPSSKPLQRRQSIVGASFVARTLAEGGAAATTLQALLQGLILRRAVLLSDLAGVQRKLDRLAVYVDTPYLLSLAGLYGPLDAEASRESCRVLRSLGATVAAFDVTLQEMRRILAVYEARIDTASGRATLDYTPMTRYFYSVQATGAYVRERAALLEVQLGKEGIVIHATPPRIPEHVEDEMALAEALRDDRGAKYTAREDHDTDCIAAVLTIRRGARPERLEDARAIFAASGRVVQSVLEWWQSTTYKGTPPIIDHSALLNYCWLKQPSASSSMLRHEMAALCADILKPSKEAWAAFVGQLERMVAEGIIDSDEAAAMLIDDLAAKYVVEAEEDGVIEPLTMADVIDRLKAKQQAEFNEEADRIRREADAEKAQLTATMEELRRASDSALATQAAAYDDKLDRLAAELDGERSHAGRLERSMERIADVVSAALSFVLTGAITAVIVAVAVFPYLETPQLSATVQRILKTVTVVLSVMFGVFGFAAIPWGRRVRTWIKERLFPTR